MQLAEPVTDVKKRAHRKFMSLHLLIGRARRIAAIRSVRRAGKPVYMATFPTIPNMVGLNERQKMDAADAYVAAINMWIAS